MINFDFQIPTRLVVGKETRKKAGELLQSLGVKKVLLHYGGSSIKKNGVYDDVVASLKEASIDFIELGGVLPNPRITLVREGIKLAKDESVDLILAVGGGSVIDSAKAIGVGILHDGDVWDLFENYVSVSKTVPVAAILTMPAAGSESSIGCVITNEERQLKKSYDHQLNRPALAIIDPEIFYTVPKDQIANGIADMMCHVFERYFTNTTNTDISDKLSEATLKTIIENGPKLLKDPKDYDAWCEIAISANLAMGGLLGIGRIPDWASHMLEHELSAIYDVAHGSGLSIIMPAWMTYVYKENLSMFVQFAVNVMGSPLNHGALEDTVLDGIERLRDFYRSLGLPVSLKEIGIDDSNFELMAKRASGEIFGKQLRLGGVKALGTQDALEIFRLAAE